MMLLSRLLDNIRKLDLDDVLAYPTPKIVTIKDRRLGALRLLAIVCVYVYFTIFRLYREEGYLTFDPLVGFVEAKLTEPDDFIPPANLTYCNENGANTLVEQFDCATLPYEFIMEGSQPREIFVTTLFYRKQFNMTCFGTAKRGANLEDCETMTPKVFVSNADRYKLTMHHGISHLSYGNYDDEAGKTTASMRGVVQGRNNEKHVVKQRLSAGVPGYDEIPISLLLRVAGVSLEELQANRRNQSVRHNGVVLFVQIHYDHNWHGQITGYTYFVTSVTGSGSAFTVAGLPEETRYFSQTEASLRRFSSVVKRRGIKIIFRQTGYKATPSFSAFMLSMVSSLALLAVANVVVENLLSYGMRYSDLYNLAKYEDSVDFSDVREGKEHAVKAIAYLTEHTDSLRTGAASKPSVERADVDLKVDTESNTEGHQQVLHDV